MLTNRFALLFQMPNRCNRYIITALAMAKPI